LLGVPLVTLGFEMGTLKGQQREIFGLGFCHGSILFVPQISRLKRFSFLFVFAKFLEYFDESTL
jgi:hypothetical protein